MILPLAVIKKWRCVYCMNTIHPERLALSWNIPYTEAVRIHIGEIAPLRKSLVDDFVPLSSHSLKAIYCCGLWWV